VTPKHPQISGWAPDFLPADEQFDRQANRLRSLLGAQVADAWVVWNLEHDAWFADLPVVLQMESGLQVEVCWEKSDDLSITWDTIDVSVKPKALGGIAAQMAPAALVSTCRDNRCHSD
jgi:hypothetical protein